MAKIEILRSGGVKYKFLLKSRNGMKLLIGEPQESLAECELAINQVKELAKDDANFTDHRTGENEPYFTIGNGHTIATSRIYASHRNLRDSLKPIRKNLADAKIIYPVESLFQD